MDETTLCCIVEDGKLWLGKKKKGFLSGHWMPYGGHLEKDESVEDCLYREVEPETGVVISDVEKVGELKMLYPPPVADWSSIIHLFIARSYTGEFGPSKEFKYHKPFPIMKLPYTLMPPADSIFLHYALLDNKKIIGEFYFNKDRAVVTHKVQFTENF